MSRAFVKEQDDADAIEELAERPVSKEPNAVTPRGLQSEGIADNQGPTVFSPALSLFHELDEGLALQAYVGKNMPTAPSTSPPKAAIHT